MRILGIDLGERRIGLALSDELGWTAQPLKVIPYTSDRQSISAIIELIRQYAVSEVVIGLPRNMDGSYGPRAERVERFARKMEQQSGVPVHLWDERLTTAAAQRSLIEADLSRRRRKQVVDKVAAVLILEGYLRAKGAQS